MLDAAVSAIITIDRKGLITYFNRAAQRMFGYAPAEVVGGNVSILMPQPYRKEHDGYIANYFRTGIRKVIGIGREIIAMKKDGTIFPIELAVSEIRVGLDLTFTGVIRDITERKRLEKEILAISEREQRRIGQDLHDGLCQQLTGIAFLVQSLQARLVSKDNSSSAESAEIAGLLKDSINQARSLSHGLYPVSPQPTGLMLALAELAANTRSIFNITCEFRCPTPVMFTDTSVATHIYRIAQEAVQNAIRHGKASRIVVNLSPLRSGWRLTVTDNGVGIPAVEKIGSGIGLRTMNHRAHVLGAKFSIARKVGGGTRVGCEYIEPEKER
jgi:two-component system CheB/CheR fusion protein